MKRWLNNLINFIRPKPRYEWQYINGTRNTVLNNEAPQGFYGAESFRLKATESIKLHKGEVIYGELVGYTDSGATIMASQDVSKLKDKNLVKKFGQTMTYKYGCTPGTCSLYVYRITHVNEDGVQIDLSWKDVVKRCGELGLKTVPHIETIIFDGNYDALKSKISKIVDGDSGFECFPSVLDSSHIEEGVVIRVESEVNGTYWLKSKNLVFLMLEGVLKENPNFVDAEEVS